MGVRQAGVDAFEPQPAQVLTPLGLRVGLAEQGTHPGTQAPAGEPTDGVHAGAQGADNGHDPRVAEPQGWGALRPSSRVGRAARSSVQGDLITGPQQAGAVTTGGVGAHPAAEDDLHLLRTPDIEVVHQQRLEERPGTPRGVEHHGAGDLDLAHRDVQPVSGGPIFRA